MRLKISQTLQPTNHCYLSSSKSTLRCRNSWISEAHFRPKTFVSVSSSLLQRSTIVLIPNCLPLRSRSFNLCESIPGIRFKNSVGINLLKSSSSSSSPLYSLMSFNLPVLAIFCKSGSLFLFTGKSLSRRKISAVCLGDLDQIIYNFLKWIVKREILLIMWPGLISPPAY